MRAAPSSMEYSVWTCRWTNESEPFGVLVVGAGGLEAFGEDIADHPRSARGQHSACRVRVAGPVTESRWRRPGDPRRAGSRASGAVEETEPFEHDRRVVVDRELRVAQGAAALL